jgi:hypothetical protein
MQYQRPPTTLIAMIGKELQDRHYGDCCDTAPKH